MAQHIYRIAEIVGTSPNGVDDAIRNAVTRANQTLRNIDWFEMTEIRGHLADGQVADWQVTVKIGFRLDDDGVARTPPPDCAPRSGGVAGGFEPQSHAIMARSRPSTHRRQRIACDMLPSRRRGGRGAADDERWRGAHTRVAYEAVRERIASGDRRPRRLAARAHRRHARSA